MQNEQQNATTASAGLFREELISCIEMIFTSMQADYPGDYRRAYPGAEPEREAKNRLYSLAKKIAPAAMYDGYDICVQLKPGYMPTLPEIIKAAYACDIDRKKADRSAIEAQQIEALPNPKTGAMPANVRSAWNKAIENAGTKSLDGLIAEHDELIRQHIREGKIRIPTTDAKLCAVPSCGSPGSLSHSISGGGNYYCGEHFQRG
jgi:hypothetical protein